jgi:hypothetical protein
MVSAIIGRIIKELVAASSSNSEGGAGASVKFEDGLWWHVDDAFAREKIGGLFRDALHIQYRSSFGCQWGKNLVNVAPLDAVRCRRPLEFLYW